MVESSTPCVTVSFRYAYQELLRALATVLGMRNPPGEVVGDINAQISVLEAELDALGIRPAHPLQASIVRGI
jgi:hypothetical protein